MDIRPKVRSAVLVGALAAVATAWAANESSELITNSHYVPLTPLAAEESTALVSEPIAVTDSLSPNETVVTTGDAYMPPGLDRSVAQSGILVEERKPSEDERIQMAVMDKLASNQNLSGKIGVESNASVVTLTGYTVTAGQAYRAGREAGSILGVKYVQNQIRPRIGGSV